MKKAAVRSILVTVVLLALAVQTEAQQPKKVARIAYLGSTTAAGSAELLGVFRKRMAQFDWIEGRNLTVEYRYAERKGATWLAELAVELVGLKVDVIVVDGAGAALAAKKATSTIPIVMTSDVDPVGRGIISSLARPGGNITGLTGFSDDLAGKRVEILKEVLPKSTRFGVITGGGTRAAGSGSDRQVKVMKEAASALGLKLVELGAASDPEKLVNAFHVAVRERVNGIVPTSGTRNFGQRNSFIVLAANYKLPAIYPEKGYVEAGGLLSYGADRRENYQRAAVYVDKILRGTKPGEIPVERPMKFEFWANLKAAKQIGLTIPPKVLVRADRVIR